MQDIKWSDKFRTGISSIDAEHEKLFEIIGAFRDSVSMNAPQRMVASTLSALREYADFHLSREELYMETYGYPRLEEHKIKHRELHNKISELVSLHARDPERMDYNEVLEFLENVLVNHVLEWDMDYVGYLPTGRKGSKTRV